METTGLNEKTLAYIKKREDTDALPKRKYRNTLNAKKKYTIPEPVVKLFGDSLAGIIKMKEIIDGLPDGMFEHFLMEYKTLTLVHKNL